MKLYFYHVKRFSDFLVRLAEAYYNRVPPYTPGRESEKSVQRDNNKSEINKNANNDNRPMRRRVRYRYFGNNYYQTAARRRYADNNIYEPIDEAHLNSMRARSLCFVFVHNFGRGVCAELSPTRTRPELLFKFRSSFSEPCDDVRLLLHNVQFHTRRGRTRILVSFSFRPIPNIV